MTVAFVAPSPSEGARTRWCRSAASGADEVPFRRGNAVGDGEPRAKGVRG